MRKSSKIALVSTVVLSILTYQLWRPLKNLWGIQVFYIGMAFVLMGLSFVLWREIKRDKFKIFITSFMYLSAVNLFDELFCKPGEIEYWEYGSFIAITTNFIYVWIANSKNR